MTSLHRASHTAGDMIAPGLVSHAMTSSHWTSHTAGDIIAPAQSCHDIITSYITQEYCFTSSKASTRFIKRNLSNERYKWLEQMVSYILKLPFSFFPSSLGSSTWQSSPEWNILNHWFYSMSLLNYFLLAEQSEIFLLSRAKAGVSSIWQRCLQNEWWKYWKYRNTWIS